MAARKEARGWTLEEWEQEVQLLGEPRFRGSQLFGWVHEKSCDDYDLMTDIPLALREKLKGFADIDLPRVLESRSSRIDATEKFLLRLSDGETVETVLMSYAPDKGRKRHSACVSTQVGCAMNCSFCATARSGWKRNLTAGEILSQTAVIQKKLEQQGEEAGLTNVVFMGMGEPLNNYEQLMKAVRILNHPRGLNISLRRITVSTCGIVPQIYCLAEERMPLVLAVSLHAPENSLRSRLVPVNRKYPLEELLPACEQYFRLTGRRVTFEYVLVKGVNDTLGLADKLGVLLQGLQANVNLIPYNSFNGESEGLVRPGRKRIAAFKERLQAAGVSATVREEKGSDIEAACGQLRSRAR